MFVLRAMSKIVLSAALLGLSFQAVADTIIPPNTVLPAGQSVVSDNGRYTLIMQNDGNLVYYRNDGGVRFATYKSGNRAVMQGDGNFVEYNSSIPVWHTVTGGNPGSYLSVQNDGNLVLYSPSNVPLWNIGGDAQFNDPTLPGEVLGRDLNVANLGWIGHVGIWDGGRVAEAMNQSGNALRYSSLSDFKNATVYWGKASPNIPNYPVYSCFEAHCTNFYLAPSGQTEKTTSRLAIAKRAYQAYLIGADYTLLAQYVSADRGDYWHPSRRGTYRCDTFVIDTLGITVYNQNSTYNAPVDAIWRSRYDAIFYGPILPKTVFNTLKTYN